MSSNDQPQECFVQIDTFPNTVIDIGGRLIYSQEFTEACLQSAYNNFGSRLYNELSYKNNISVGSVNLDKITHAKGIPAKFLRPGLPWIAGRVRVRLVVEAEFEPENLGSVSSESPLDDLRKDVG